MKKGLWNKRIPSLLAFVILFGSIWVTTILIQSGVIFVGQAGPDKEPQNVNVSNITDTSFTVSFTTRVPTQAAISVEDGTLTYVVFDNRDSGGGRKEYYSHYITVPDLKPATTYSFSILSDGETYLQNGQNYSVTTGSLITDGPPNLNPISGKIILNDGGPATDTIVRMQAQGSQVVTTITRDDGTYIIPINSVRTSGLNSYFDVSPETELSISAFRGQETAQVSILYENALSVPTMTLGNTYNFTQVDEDGTSTASSQLKEPSIQGGSGTVQITSPRASQSFVDNRPTFRGTARPNQKVKLTIQPSSITAEPTTDGNGVWTFRPETPLLPGEHTLTLIGPDRFGISQSVSRQFSVFSSGSQVDQSATPSATPTSTATPTLEPTVSPTVTVSVSPSPSATPSASPTPTLTSTPTPTLEPTAIVATSIPTTPPAITTPEPPGSNSTLILTIISTILIVSGGALLFLL